MRILLLLSSGTLWNVQAQTCLSFVLQKEQQPLSEHKEGGDEPWAPGPSAGAEPQGGVGPFSLLQLQLPNHWKRSGAKSG